MYSFSFFFHFSNWYCVTFIASTRVIFDALYFQHTPVSCSCLWEQIVLVIIEQLIFYHNLLVVVSVRIIVGNT